jgi:hypothetical protein
VGLELRQLENGRWDWCVYQSAYGLACGEEGTVEQAVTEMVIAEAAILEVPYPPAVREFMRANPEKIAAEYDWRGVVESTKQWDAKRDTEGT